MSDSNRNALNSTRSAPRFISLQNNFKKEIKFANGVKVIIEIYNVVMFKIKSKADVYCRVERKCFWRMSVEMVKTWLFIAGLTIFFSEARAQYGNEWIQFNQEYYRIPVAQTGLYRVTYSDLQQSGFPVNTIDPRRLQLFHRGVEQSIYIEGEADAQFNTTDYIEFLGKKNDGVSDTDLYKPASAQPHTFHNLFSDTTVYFLTYSNLAVQGKRIQKTWEVNVSGIPQEQAHNDEKLLVLTQEHSDGTAYLTYVRNTFFDVGEAWTGKEVLQNNFIDYTLEGLTNGVQSAGMPQFEILVTGRSDVNAPHRAEIYVGPTPSSLRLITTQDILKFNFSKITQVINWTDIGGDGKLVVRLRVLATGTSARASVSYVKINYPQSFNANSAAEKYFNLNVNGGGKSFITIQNTPVGARLFDITDPNSVLWYNPPASTFNPVISNTNVPRNLFLTNSVKSVSGIKLVKMRSIIPSQHEYVILSHPSLMKAGGNYADPVRAYGAYRASSEGGSYDTLVVDILQLYNQFNFGEVSPLAIHRFMKYMVNGGSPKYLFIIGKGLDWFHNYHRNPSSPDFSIYKDFVPSAGAPASDMFYTIGLGSSQYEPAVPTGRISATQPAQVAAYLDKVKETEAFPFNNLWRKKVIHLSGGLTAQETIDFRHYLEGYASVAEDIYLGGIVKAQAKNTTNVGELINISAEVNQGVNLVTFFGHSSATTSDFEVGFVSNTSLGYNNPGKYPVFLINGCNAGDFFAKDIRYGEDWILASNKGATGFIAHSSFGFTSALRYYSDIFYRLAYGDSLFMSKGIGDIQQEAAKRFMTYLDPSEVNLTQISQMFLLGDPAVKVFGASKPDYEINSTSITHESVDGNPITAFSESFALNISIRNFGRATGDSIRIRVTRIFNDASSESYDSLFKPVFYQDTLQFVIKQERNKGFGNNTFQVELDPEQNISELSEDNNSAVYDLFIPLNITKNIFPYDFAIVNTAAVNFTFSSTDIAGIARDFELEIDTVNTFISPYIKKITVNGTLAVHTFDLLAQDSLVYYWRTRFKNPGVGEVGEWITSSFVFINIGQEGWAQLHFPQYLKNETSGLVTDPELKLLKYNEYTLTIDLLTFGSNHVLPGTSVSAKLNGEEYNPNDMAMKCRDNTINLIAFDKRSTIPYTAVLFNPFDGRACGRRPQVINSFLTSQLQTGGGNDIFQYMLNVPEGDSVVLFTIGDPGIALWNSTIKAQFEMLGISSAQLSSVQAGEPVIIFGKKGTSPGSALLFKPEGIPANEQELQVSKTITGRFDTGSMKTQNIGPAQNWQTFISHALVSETPVTDEFSFDIMGVSLSGAEQLLLPGVSGTVDLSFIDPAVYPYLKLAYNTNDPVNLTPPQLVKWIVQYTPVAEGVLTFTSPESNPILKEGKFLTSTFGFKNISQKSFSDSLTVRYNVYNRASLILETKNLKIKAPLPNESTTFILPTNTKGKGGLNDLEVYVNPKIIPELYYDNNVLRLDSYLTVLTDRFKPVLDVTVDGRYLVDGDFVSPNPVIGIKVWDENLILQKTDPDGVIIRLTYPGVTFPTEITFDRPDVTWFPQTETEFFCVEFSPENLPEGVYTLTVEARDVSSNSSGTTPYTIHFEVLFEEKIVLRSPHPNPSASVFNFELLISGNTPPDYLELQIISATGIFVRSIEVTEFHIGTNRILWDGRDHSGNEVPAGFYIYQLLVTKNEQRVPIELSEGDKFLKGGYGKIIVRR